MRMLVTGGAGFIGSAVVDQLVDGGHDVVVLDRLLPARPRSGKPDYLHAARPSTAGSTSATRDAVDDVVAGVDAVCHQAAMVGLGVDFDDAPDYVAHNDLGTAVAAARAAPHGFAGRIVLASSMVVYGEGAYRCAEHGPVAPGAARRADLDAGRFEPPCPRATARSSPEPSTRTRRSTPATCTPPPSSTRSTSATPTAASTARRSIALRYHNVYGPRMPRDTPYAGVAAHLPQRGRAGRGAPGVRGRRPAPRLRPRARRRPRQRAALDAPTRRRSPARSTSPRVTRTRCSTWPSPWPRAVDGGRRPRSSAATASATSATCSPRPTAPTGARLRAAVDLRRRHARVRHRPPPEH